MSQHNGANESAAACWVGVDVSKKFFDAAIARSDQRFPSTALRELPCKRFPMSKDGVRDMLEWLAACEPHAGVYARVVMEATGNYSVQLAAWLLQQRAELGPAIVNAGKAKSFIDSLGQRNRTDHVAARGLAFFGVERTPSPYEPLTPERQTLRDLSRHRATLVEQRTALKNRFKEACVTELVNQQQERQLEELERDIKEVEDAMRRHIKAHGHLKRDYKLLTSIPGVGFVTASIVLAELGDLRRFRKARQLTALVGVSPRIIESGTSVRKRTRMCKWGNSRVRQALYLSSMATLRTRDPNDFKRTYVHLCERGKTGKSSIGAVMRKQMTVMRAVLINEQPYDPFWKTRG